MSNKTYIVGIGASAGGLEAITQLITHLRPDAPFAYVVLQHLSPSYRSMMVEILGRETALKVKEASQGDAPQAGTIYVVPSNYNALIKDGHLQLITAPPEVVPKPSINQFLISLAAEEGESAIGIVLSGTGSDGVAGLRAIQAAGGFTFAQKPETAKYDGMPRSAIEAGVVDHVLAPEEIAIRLPQLLELPQQEAETPPADLLERLLNRLRDRLQFDFSGYKIGTLMRRIRRREIATGNEDLASYLAWVEHNPHELDLLARDILISVTAFFRDREAFDALRRLVQDICLRKPPGSEIRVWVAGCASGEEAYSIAMLFADVLDERLPQYRVQIFATDIDDAALNVARRGVYPAAAMSEIASKQIERHFRPVNAAFEAGKHLRDMIVFARHNLVSDPPFLRLDLISCRNVLIYFDAPLQAKVLQTFHFGLVKDGYLFLGRSESVAQAEQMFSAVDRRERLFRKRGDLPAPPASGIVVPIKMPAQRRERKIELMLTALAQHFGVTCALCDAEGTIQHTVGQVESFLQFPVGATRLTISDVALPALRGELLTLLHRCGQSGRPQRGRRRKLGKDWLRMHIEPLSDAGMPLQLVLFVPEKRTDTKEITPPSPPSTELEDELVATREHLQTLIEEMATANEEMQALNEEAQASNEELQATNEELEAANEELQATNQELVSLNEELNVKTQEYSLLNEEYAHLYDALQFPLLVFDRGLQLVRFNAPAARRFDLRPTALKQHISHLRLPAALGELEMLLGRVLAHGDREEISVQYEQRTLRLAVAPGLDKAGEVVTLIVSLIDVTELTHTLAQLAESQSRLSALMEKTTVIFAMKDMTGGYLYANRRFLEFFGLGDADYAGKNDFALLPHTLAADLWALDLTALRENRCVEGEHVFEHKGQKRCLRSVHQVLHEAFGQPIAFIIEAEDITRRKQAEEQMRITARVFDQAGEAIIVASPQGIIQTVNAAFTRITGYSYQEAIGQKTTLLKSGRHSGEFYHEMWRQLNEQGYWQGEIWNKRKSGEIYPEWLTINRIDDEQGEVEHYVAVFSDITSIKDSQRKAEYLATHDVLTGLPNRTLFQDRLKHSLAQCRRNKSRLALLFIDLDNFKTINDTLGHDIGDKLLKQAADRLREVVRDIDTVARLGGDEFTAVIADADATAADQVARRIVDELSRSFEVESRSLFVSASVGIAFFPDDGVDSASLIKAADAAMYRAKEQGRNRVEFFKPDLQVRLLKRAVLEGALREALRLNRLRLVYQPKFSLADGHPLIGAEALLRWHDPELGEVSPAEFIPVAEAGGLILDVDREVRRLLIAQLLEWLALGIDLPVIAFNVSPRSVREPSFAQELLSEVQEAGLPLGRLQIEITEGALLENSQHVLANLNALDCAGLHIAIDDFGTGYSSLSYLKRLPLNELKIDRSFVTGLGADRESEAIARAVLGLARALELQSVAEGVETDQQLAWLIQHGCDIAQGYYFARPMEVAAFEDQLAQRG